MDNPLFQFCDAWLIAPYRWLQWSQASFLLGTTLLALYCVLIGQVCLLVMDVLQQRRREKFEHDAHRHSDLALQALLVQDKDAYLAQNTLAKDAFSQSMSLAVGRMAASLWPALVALAWMDLRFRDVPLELPFALPGVGTIVFYPFPFVLIYVALRLILARLRGVLCRQRLARPS